MFKRQLIIVIAGICAACVPQVISDPETNNLQIPEPIQKQTPKLVTPEKTVVLPTKNLPAGWMLNREPMAFWGESLPSVIGISPDSLTAAEYWEETIEVNFGFKLPLKKAKVSYQSKTRVTREVVELHFVNVDNIYSITNYEPSHYELEGILKTIELIDTGFPQLLADDVLKHKVLMEYGTPDDFDGTWHRYEDKETTMAVRVIDDMHLAVQLQSKDATKRLKQAIRDMYSEEGIEQKKQQLLKGFDL